MKKIVYVSIAMALFFAACYKPPEPKVPVIYFNSSPDSGYMSLIGKYVRQHPVVANYDDVNFTQYRISKQRKCWYTRLPFKNKSMATDFILLQTDTTGNVLDGRIVHLEKKAAAAQSSYNGSIDIRFFDSRPVIHSSITGGYIEAFHPGLTASSNRKGKETLLPAEGQAREAIIPGPYDELPEVVVVAYLPKATDGGGISVADYMMLESLFSDNGSGGGDAIDLGYGIYNPIDGGLPLAPSNGGWIAADPSTPQGVDPNLALAFDDSFFRPAIDLNAWLKCFSNIPDAGATAAITLCGDLPVPSNPTAGLNIWNGNTGHCFLQLTKTNGAESVTQIIGFTAQSAGLAIVNTEAFVPGKIVDNAGHKYNCSLTMDLTPAGLNTVIDKMKSLANRPYSVVNYDCLDFGLEVINAVRGNNPLVISKTYNNNDPFSNIATGSKLYAVLQSMINNGSPEAGNILVGSSVYAGVSHGACQ